MFHGDRGYHMNIYDANNIVKFLKSIRTQNYKIITVVIDKKWGYGVRVYNLHNYEAIEHYSMNHYVFKRMCEEVKTDYDLLSLVGGKFVYYN